MGDKDSTNSGDLQIQPSNTNNCNNTNEPFTDVEVEELHKQLREKDLVLTDIRLEALSSAHQLESLKDTVMKMRVSHIRYSVSIQNSAVILGLKSPKHFLDGTNLD